MCYNIALVGWLLFVGLISYIRVPCVDVIFSDQLMRRAVSALKKCSFTDSAVNFLRIEGEKSRALSFLLHSGWLSLHADRVRVEAKRRLMLRCIHAKKFKPRKDEARKYLYHTAQAILQFSGLKTVKIEREALPPKAKQCDYASLFKISSFRSIAHKWLLARAQV